MFNTIQLSKSSQTPLYLQLANGLALFIETSKLPTGAKLPSIRSLAKELKINRDTVVSAYKVLEQRGLANGQTGRGTYVCPLSHLPESKDPDIEPFSITDNNLINLSSFSLPNDFYVTKALVEICRYLKDYSIDANPNLVGILSSLPGLIGALPKTIDNPGICIESPCKDISIFKEYGFESFEVPLTQDGLDIDVLENHLKTGNIKYIYIMPYLQNPTGICYSKDNKKQILELANTYNAYIIENDIFSDLLLDDVNYCPLYSQSTYDNVIYIKHFSHLYLPGINCFFVVFPSRLSDINCRQDNFTCSLVYSFLHNSLWHTNRELLIKHYHEKYLLLCNLIDLHLSQYLSYTSALGGLYIWLTLKTSHISAEDLCSRLVPKYILISPGSLFFSHKDNPPSIRISIARTDTLQIERGIKIIASVLSSSEFE